MRTLLAVLALLSLAACQQDGPAINLFLHQVTTETGSVVKSCTELGNGDASSGSSSTNPASDFWFSDASHDERYVLTIGSAEETLEHRVYDLDFAESRKVDHFSVFTHSGTEYVVFVWGSSACDEPCPPIEYEARPGDPTGCGTEASAASATSAEASALF